MNKAEFAAWKKETERSAQQWAVDLIHNGLDGQDLLTFKGGVNGKFLQVDSDGNVSIGTYEGAVPHIGEAMFKTTGSYKCANFDEAMSRVLKALGSQFLLEFIYRA